MYHFVFLGIVILSLAVVAVIVFRKFPQLANVDINNLPQEKERQKKKEILDRRIREKGEQVKKRWARSLSPVVKLWKIIQLRFRIYVGKIERLWHHEQSQKKKETPAVEVKTEADEQKVKELIGTAEDNLRDGHFDQAEDLFIAAIKLDQRLASAYRGLGDTYLSKGKLEEARETYRFVLQLEPDDDSVLVKLAEIAESQGDLEEAIDYYQQAVVANDAFSTRFFHIAELLLKVNQPAVAREAVVQAVELEPKNPKYLDLLLEIAIILRDKNLAQRGYNELRAVNPENNKLDEFRVRVDQI